MQIVRIHISQFNLLRRFKNMFKNVLCICDANVLIYSKKIYDFFFLQKIYLKQNYISFLSKILKDKFFKKRKRQVISKKCIECQVECKKKITLIKSYFPFTSFQNTFSGRKKKHFPIKSALSKSILRFVFPEPQTFFFRFSARRIFITKVREDVWRCYNRRFHCAHEQSQADRELTLAVRCEEQLPLQALAI